MTTTTMFDGLLDDDEPQTLTTPELVDQATANEHQAEVAPTAFVAPANPKDEAIIAAVPAADAPSVATVPAVDETEKLVLVEGQRFIVDAAVADETVRQHLIRQGFAQLAGAEIRAGTAEHDGRTLATVEFIKKAGTKG